MMSITITITTLIVRKFPSIAAMSMSMIDATGVLVARVVKTSMALFVSSSLARLCTKRIVS